MYTFIKKCCPLFILLFIFAAADLSVLATDADARARGGGFGGRSFRSAPAQRQAPRQQPNNMRQQQQQKQQPGAAPATGGFGRGLMGGLLGAGIGALLFGSMFGMGGNGMGILPLLLLAGAGYFFYRRFMKKPAAEQGYQSYQAPGAPNYERNYTGQDYAGQPYSAPFQDIPAEEETGLAAIRKTDPEFDEAHFLEVASDVFFRVQAGWMRRDIESFRHLLGAKLTEEYAEHFREMTAKHEINKLESISVRKVSVADAGSDGSRDFVTVLFTANLLDYTVDDRDNSLIRGSMTEPVKFAEEWTWTRPVGTDDWLLEGIEVVEG